VPFPVLLDEDGSAAAIAGTNTLTLGTIVSPSQLGAGLRATIRGKRQHRTGRRPSQLGATLVIGPGDELRYADFEDHAGDHAPIEDVLRNIGRSPG